MEKSDYLSKKNELDSKIKELQIKLHQLKKDYIEKNRKFENGDLIKIITAEFNYYSKIIENNISFGYVDGFELNYKDEVIPILLKQKKDGTKSKNKLYLPFGKYTLEKV